MRVPATSDIDVSAMTGAAPGHMLVSRLFVLLTGGSLVALLALPGAAAAEPSGVALNEVSCAGPAWWR